MNEKNTVCIHCGECCREYTSTFSATVNDIERWKKEKRNDILAYVEFIDENNTWGDLFFHPSTGREIFGRCPFLKKVRNEKKFLCKIHSTKPDVCREYPKDGVCLHGRCFNE